MSDLKIFDDLETLLNEQTHLFDRVIIIQNAILKTLDEEADFSKMMDLLNQKEEIVTKISSNSLEHQPFIADWMQRKAELAQDPRYHKVDSLLEVVSNKAKLIQDQDEKMMNFFNNQKNTQADVDPQNLLNAYRGLR